MEKFFFVAGSIFGLIFSGFYIFLILVAAYLFLGEFRSFILALFYRSNKVKFMELMAKNQHGGHLLKYASGKLKSKLNLTFINYDFHIICLFDLNQ